MDKTCTMKRRNGDGYWKAVDDQTGDVVGVDKYQNDLKPRLERLGYSVNKVGE